MRKRVLAGVLVLAALVGVGRQRTVVIRAQSLPVTRTASWDANPAPEAVTNYTVTLDGVVVGNPTGTTQAVTFTTAGPHTLTVTATNLWDTSSPATLNVVVVTPGSPKNPKVQR